MNQSQKGFTQIIVAVILALIIGTFVGYRFLGKNDASKAEQDNNGMAMTETAGLKTYTNAKYGFKFSYPPEWGEVKETILDTSDRAKDFCGVGTHALVYGIPDSVHAADVSIEFQPNSANLAGWKGFLNVVKFDRQNAKLTLCAENDKFVDLAKDKSEFLAYPSGFFKSATMVLSRATFINKNGIKILYYPYGFTALHTDLNAFFKIYGEDVEIEWRQDLPSVSMDEWPEYDCQNEQKFGSSPDYYNCGMVYWAQKSNSPEAKSARQTIQEMRDVLDTFEFIK